MPQFKVLPLYFSLGIAAERIRKEARFHNLWSGWNVKKN